MKNSLLALTILALLLSGYAQKTNSLKIYTSEDEIENKDFSCSDEAELQSTPFGIKFVTCKSK